MPYLAGNGARELRELAAQLARAGSSSGLRAEVRKAITVAVKPMEAQVKANARNIPAHGPASTGLRAALARATRTNIRVSGTNTRVRLLVDGKRMPAGQGKLPVYMEGSDGATAQSWRHPVFGDEEDWVPQESHVYFANAIPPHLPGVSAAVNLAIAVTAEKLLKG